jgi:hypothetical protein
MTRSKATTFLATSAAGVCSRTGPKGLLGGWYAP